MTALLLAFAIALPGKVERDTYGVAKVTAATFEEAQFLFGKTVAEDRLWQIETSRRVARGHSAELLGSSALPADKETLLTGYTDKEYDEMFAALPKKAQAAFTEYSRGVNEAITERKTAGTLPAGYAENQIQPEPWTVTDSMAIVVMLSRRFGTGGAGELRNLAMTLYLKTQPCKDKYLDVIDDMAWQNDPASIPTVRPDEDPLAKGHPEFPKFTRTQTEDQLAKMPKVNLLELVPAIRAANGDESRLIAESVQAPFKTGSYCMVVSPSRSANGRALLLTAPQMGHSIPSIIHEIAISAPGINVAGIDVPGIPCVVIGNTPNFAWGLTTGVADIADIVYSTKSGDSSYLYGTETRPIQKFKHTIKVKGRDPVEYEVSRTAEGPVIFESRTTNSIFSQKMSYWKKEVESWASLYDLYQATGADAIEKGVSQIAMNMNFFYATTAGDTGYRYLGKMPIRSAGFDPRFPTPASKETEWKGFVPFEMMPHVRNPKSGLIANWNNKPASWWDNLDTPVWGSIFRNEVLLESLKKPKLTPFDLERAAWDIARKETDSNGAFADALSAPTDPASLMGQTMHAFDGWVVQGSAPSLLYREAVRELRKELFGAHTGNFTNDSLFERAVQAPVIMKALTGGTKYNFLAGRKEDDVALAAVNKAYKTLVDRYGDEPATWPASVGAFAAPASTPVFYPNRGTYIQINELAKAPVARSIAAPGVTETGPFSDNQVNLARQWLFKPVWRVFNPEQF